MINDPTGEIEDDNPIPEDYEGNTVLCKNCGEPCDDREEFCSEECWEEFQMKEEKLSESDNKINPDED